MPATEIRDRLAGTMRREAARLAHRARPAAWRREDLAAALVPRTAELAGAITHLSVGRSDDAHAALARHFATRPRRWPIAPTMREPVARTIRARFPEAAAAAVRRADAIVEGRFDLLGYRDLRFRASPQGSAHGDAIDWHRDPVHGRVAPALFWSEVPYLDPACGDHKIIWELNRHQHFLTLGRAWWLAGHAQARATFVSHLAGWMDANPPLVGINWASMLELALRSLSWIWALEFFVEPAGGDDRADRQTFDAHPWIVDLLLGLDRQLHLVEQNLSTYFSPNTHLLGEALALYVAGRSLPELRRAPAWAELGRRTLIEEMSRQISPDGGHVERSFHYHRYTLDFYLLALAVARLTGDDTRPFAEAARRLARFARTIADDRGHLARIGDDDGGQLFPICGRDSADASDSLALSAWLLGDPSLAVGPAPEEAVWMSGRGAAIADADRTAVPIPSTSLGDSGYTICRTERGDHLVFDTGPHGYLNGGHAHADALSMTLTVAGRPLLVDPGTACYTIDPARRDRFRSTRLHNTLVLDGREQSEPSGPFHWASAAAGSRLAWCTSPRFDYVEGTHDGYAPLVHRRAVLSRPGCWIVADRVLGDGEHQADLHWHLDPRWTITAAGVGWLRADDGAGDPIWMASLQGEFDVVRGAAADGEPGLGWVAPAYGHVVPGTTLRLTHRGAAPFALVTVLIEASDRPSIEALPVRINGTVDGTAAGLRFVTGNATDTVVFGSTTLGTDLQSDMRRRRTVAGHLESDAALLWCRTRGAQPEMHVAVVDGSLVRTLDGRVILSLAAPVPFRETVA